MADMSLAEGLDTLARRTRAAVVVIYIFLGLSLPMALGEFLESSGAIDLDALYLDPLSTLFAFVSLGYFVVLLVSIVLVAMWIYRAHANLRAAGMDVEFTPGWAVGWYFIPIANLFKPFQAMRELWNSSRMLPTDFGGQAPSDVKVWWACYIVGNILSTVGMRMTLPDGTTAPTGLAFGGMGTLVTAAAAYYLLQLVRGIDLAQRDEMNTAEVFA
jgi:hypothetical protein